LAHDSLQPGPPHLTPRCARVTLNIVDHPDTSQKRAQQSSQPRNHHHRQPSKYSIMATRKGTFTHYTGPISGLTSTSSPGFLFLSTYIAGIDALDRSSPAARKLHEILSPTATFTNNGGECLPLSKVELMFGQRAGMLEKFEHGSPVTCWDLETEGGGVEVIVECASK
jgi:hypothetical protein